MKPTFENVEVPELQLGHHRLWLVLSWDRMGTFSTNFLLRSSFSDRKVFLSKGKLKCAGSSLFLKKKWGIGYHLRYSHLRRVKDEKWVNQSMMLEATHYNTQGNLFLLYTGVCIDIYTFTPIRIWRYISRYRHIERYRYMELLCVCESYWWVGFRDQEYKIT